MANALGFRNLTAFGEWIKYVSDLAYSLERLAPALAASGPNPEYPWPHENPVKAPLEYNFQVWADFQTRNGHALTRLLQIVLERFEQWF